MKMTNNVIVFLAISLMHTFSGAQSAGISSSCTSTLVTLSPCLNYITGNSSSPTSSCCTQLASVVKSSPECLCEVVNSGGGGGSMAAGLNINQTQALNLPNACDVKTPPLSSCSKASAATPSKSPAGTSPSTTTTTPATLPSGSKTTPTTDGDSNDASNSNWAQFSFIWALLFVTSYGLMT